MPLRTVDFSMEGAGRTLRGATVFLCPHSRRCLLNNRDFGVGLPHKIGSVGNS